MGSFVLFIFGITQLLLALHYSMFPIVFSLLGFYIINVSTLLIERV